MVMSAREQYLTLVDHNERLALALGASVLYYRRLSLGALASIERMHAEPAPTAKGGPAGSFISPAALESAIASHVLVGWEGVTDPLSKAEVAFCPALARRLPAGVRRLLVAKSREINPPTIGGENESGNTDHRP
jgi:hypothetical protein